MATCEDLCARGIAFVCGLVESLSQGENFLATHLDPQMVWIGPECGEPLRGAAGREALVAAMGAHTVDRASATALMVGDMHCQVDCSLQMEACRGTGALRLSALVCFKDPEPLLLRGHLFCGSDNVLALERALLERTQALRLAQKRYEVALSQMDASMFEYDISTKELILTPQIAQMYNLPQVVENGVETFVSTGIIASASAPQYLEMYRRIYAGEPRADCYVYTRAANGVIYDFQLSLHTVYDEVGRPVRAIGVRKNVTQMRRLQNEREYGRALASGKLFVFEANITRDLVLYLHENWRTYTDAKNATSFSLLVRKIADVRIALESRQAFLEYFTLDALTKQLADGPNPLTFSYLRKGEDSVYDWYEGTLNVIRDIRTEDINLRFYHRNITEQRQKEQRALEERRLYESMLAKAAVAYDVNVSTNQLLTGHENWQELYDIEPQGNFDQMMEDFAQKAVHPDDSAAFLEAFSRDTVLLSFSQGEQVPCCEYRKANAQHNFRWVLTTLHLYEDPENGEVRGFFYVEDIDERKKLELSLKYDAEHDRMTGLYNKPTIESLITSFLQKPAQKERQHAFLMIDIDNFKAINDTFGHMFGDVVLAELAGTIRASFRGYDLVGRMGGDEFGAFMNNVHSAGVVKAKAAELCQKLVRTYGQENVECTVSASIGIALYSQHGKTFEALYAAADDALYRSKRAGKNQYST